MNDIGYQLIIMSKKADFVDMWHRSDYQCVQNELYHQYCEYCYNHYNSKVIYCKYHTKYVHKQATIMFKCYIFRIWSLQLDPTIIERVRMRCTLCHFTVYQTGTNFMVNIKAYQHQKCGPLEEDEKLWLKTYLHIIKLFNYLNNDVFLQCICLGTIIKYSF